MSIDRKKYIDEFVEEMTIEVEKLNNLVLQLEKDPTNENLFHNAFRCAHTIKGSAGVIEFPTISQLAHKIENLFSEIRSGKITLSTDLISLLLNCCDKLNSCIESVRSNPYSNPDTTDTQNLIDEFLIKSSLNKTDVSQKLDVIEITDYDKLFTIPFFLTKNEIGVLETLLRDNYTIYLITFILKEKADIKETRIELIREKLLPLGNILMINPSLDYIRDNFGILNVQILYASKISESEIKNIINVDCVENINISKINNELLHKEYSLAYSDIPIKDTSSLFNVFDTHKVENNLLHINASKIDSLMKFVGELIMTKGRLGQLFPDIYEIVLNKKNILTKMDKYISSLNSIKDIIKDINTNNFYESEKNSFQKIQGNIDWLTKELLQIIKSLKEKDYKSLLYNLEDSIYQLEVLTENIQENVMQIRMMPMFHIFSKFRRVIRDLSKSLNKEIRFEITGEEIELDKNIMEHLFEPLIHIVRNAISHGIEPSEERIKLGKNKTGTLQIKCTQHGNYIWIEVIDDGRGLDPNLIVNMAIEKGFITKSTSLNLTKKQKLDLIFLQGFTTDKEVTELSGRGVGMDAVKNAVESINGSIEIKSDAGTGTNVILKIPLTLAIIHALIITVNNQFFAVSIKNVAEIFNYNDLTFYTMNGIEMFDFRNESINFVNLNDLLGMESYSPKTEEAKVVVITDGKINIGILVDSLITEEELVIKPLSEHFSYVKGIAGISLLGNGKITLVMDVIEIIKMHSNEAYLKVDK